MSQPDYKPGDPYCSACGYLLRGSTESSRCPECGKPLVESMQRYQPASAIGVRSVRRRSRTAVFGWPVFEIALGPDPLTGERLGRARAIVAVGDVATGGIAIGGIAFGVVSFGGVAIGLGSMGGLAIGLLSAAGGGAIGGIAAGGFAGGGLCTGGLAVGGVASGGMAIGYYARGGMAIGSHTISGGKAPDPEAVRVFDTLRPVMGTTLPGVGLAGGARAALTTVGVSLLLAMIIGLIVLTMARPIASKQ